MAVTRGRCGGCGRTFAITTRGVVRGHESGYPREGHGTFGPCVGGGLPPVDVDAPLLTDEVRQLRSEVASLRHMLAAEQSNAQAWQRRAEANDALRDVEAALWALCETYRKQNRSHWEESRARFDAEMEALRARYPLLRPS